MNRYVVAAVIALGGLGGACAAQAPSAMRATAATPAGFLGSGALQTLVDAVPPPPFEGSPGALADVAASERLRVLEDTDRWTLATRHAELRPAIAVSHFDCVVGAQLTAGAAPSLVALLDRVLIDANAAAELGKARAFRPRPVGVDAGRRSCQVVSAAGRASASYPSGSASVGAAYGEVFARLVPDRAVEAREMGRQIGISRLVCAMHYPSDVEAGRTLGVAVVAAEVADPAFAPAIKAARADLDRVRATGLTSPACAAERLALATPLP